MSWSSLFRKDRVRFSSCSEKCLLWASESFSWIAKQSKSKAGLSSSTPARGNVNTQEDHLRQQMKTSYRTETQVSCAQCIPRNPPQAISPGQAQPNVFCTLYSQHLVLCGLCDTEQAVLTASFFQAHSAWNRSGPE